MSLVGRRSYLRGLGALTALGTTGGCLGVLTGEEPAEFSAAPSTVEQGALDETGYEAAGVDEVVVEREYEVADQTRAVVVTNYRAQYEKAIDLGPLGEQRGAVFTSLTTPRVNVLGREFNPVADMGTAELAEMVQDQYDGIDDIEHVEDGEVTIDGETTTQGKLGATGSLQGEPVDLYLHVSEAVELGEDLAVTVGGYPQVKSDEEENVLRLMEAVRPDA